MYVQDAIEVPKIYSSNIDYSTIAHLNASSWSEQLFRICATTTQHYLSGSEPAGAGRSKHSTYAYRIMTGYNAGDRRVSWFISWLCSSTLKKNLQRVHDESLQHGSCSCKYRSRSRKSHATVSPQFDQIN